MDEGKREERGNREKEKGVDKRRREMRWEKMDIKGGEMGKWEKRDWGSNIENERKKRKGGVSPLLRLSCFFHDFPFTRKQLQIIG